MSQQQVYDVIIIGAGPAGLTAGLYTSRARLNTLMFESFSVACQAVTTDHIENYPGFPDGVGGFALIDSFRKQAEKFGLEFKNAHIEKLQKAKTADGVDCWSVSADGEDFKSLALIIATGAHPKELRVPGEAELRGKGVSYCATCDGAFFREREVVVVGGGDTAVEEAVFLTKFAKKVTIVHRRDRLRATKVLQERAQANDKIAFAWNSVAEEITGSEKVEGIKLKNISDESEKTLACDGVFIFVGYAPNTGFAMETVKTDEQGYILADADMATSEAGIFACGDCIKKKLRQVVTACGDGATAAFSAQHYVEELKGIAYK